MSNTPIEAIGAEQSAAVPLSSVRNLPLGTPDRTWAEYGMEVFPVLESSERGETISNRWRYNLIRQDGRDIAVVSRNYQAVPHGYVNELVQTTGLNLQETYDARNGNVRYWQLMSDKRGAVTGDLQRGDLVQFGAMVHNSIDGSMNFGGNVFTLRLVCTNGATRRSALADFAMRHVGRLEKFGKDAFKEIVEKLFSSAADLLAYYRVAAQVQVNQNMVDSLLRSRLPPSYFGENISVDTDKTKTVLNSFGKEIKIPVATINRPQTVWGAFNDVTRNVWHGERASIKTKDVYTQIAHAALITPLAI